MSVWPHVAHFTRLRRHVLTIRELEVRYGRSRPALHGIDVDVAEDGVLAVLGANRAGKSTLLRAVAGTLPLHGGAITAGEIRYRGKRLDGLAPAAIVRSGVAGVPEGRQVFGRMTVEENLRAGALVTRTAAARKAARNRVLALFPALAERAHTRAGLLSGGEQQMLAIGRALMARPQLLFLDEPSLGLAPRMVRRFAAAVREIHAQGTTVVLVEQNASMALAVADRVLGLRVGTVALVSGSADLAGGDDLRDLYIGDDGNPVGSAHRGSGQLSRWVP